LVHLSRAATALVVVAVCVAMNLLARGVSETYAVFLLPLENEFGWGRATLTGVYSSYMLVHGLSAPLVGLLFDRLGPRILYAGGALCLGGGYFLAGRLEQIWQFHLCVGLLGGIGVAAMGMVPASALVSRWFRARLGTAMGVTYAGLGLGVIIVVPFTQWLVELDGWRSAYTYLGSFLLMLVPVLLILPWRHFAAGNPEYRSQGGPRAVTGWTLSGAIRTAAFWGLFAVFFFTAAAIFSTILQAVAYLVEIGFAPLQAATAFGALGVMSVLGMIATGWLTDRVGRRSTATVSYVLTIVGIGCLFLLAQFPYYWLLVVFVLCFGISQGSRGPVVSILCAELFAGSGIGAIYGALTLGMGTGAAFGAWGSGWLRDITGGYEAGFLFAAVTALLGLSQFWIIPALARGVHPASATASVNTAKLPLGDRQNGREES
jgi:MFS family permease